MDYSNIFSTISLPNVKIVNYITHFQKENEPIISLLPEVSSDIPNRSRRVARTVFGRHKQEDKIQTCF